MFSLISFILSPYHQQSWSQWGEMLHYWTEWSVKKLKVPTHRHSISAQVILRGFITILVTATSRQAKHWATWESHLKCWSLINILWAGCLLMWLRVCGFSFNAVCHPDLRLCGTLPGHQWESETWIYQSGTLPDDLSPHKQSAGYSFKGRITDFSEERYYPMNVDSCGECLNDL